MRQSRVLLLLVLVIISVTLLPALFFGLARQADNESITAGVILTRQAADFGWEGLTFDRTGYAITTIRNHRLIVFQNLNRMTYPDRTLHDVIMEMGNRERLHVVFVSGGFLAGPNERPVNEVFANTLFVMNAASRQDVDRLLETLPAVRSDIDRTGEQIRQEDSSTVRVDEPTGDASSSPSTVFTWAIIASTLGIGLTVAVLWSRVRLRETAPSRKKKGTDTDSPFAREQMIRSRIKQQVAQLTAAEPSALVKRLAVYVKGDTHFDESYEIERGASLEFLGECGINAAGNVSRYDRTTINGFDVWVFDQQSAQTISGALVSENEAQARNAHQNESADSVTVASPGAVLTLTTKNLVLEAHILSMSYDYSDVLPRHSVFDHMAVLLIVRTTS